MDRLALRKTSYKPPRGLKLTESDSLISINALLKPWGFRLRYWGYDRVSMNYVYEFVTTKPDYAKVKPELVVIYHHADMTEEEWLAELKSRLYQMGDHYYYAAYHRYRRTKINREKNYQYKRKRRTYNKEK